MKIDNEKFKNRSMFFTMNKPSITPPEERLDAPYANLAQEDLEQYQGKVIAVDRNGAGIIGAEDTIEDLRRLMELTHPNVDYRTLPVADLSGVVNKAN